MSIVVHNLQNSRSLRPMWLLEELGVPYEVKTYQRDPGMRRGPAEIRKVHPLGKAPTVVVDGQALSETGAIFEHLIDTVGQGRLRPPRGTPEHTRFTFWMHYAEGSVMQLLVVGYAIRTVAQLTEPSAQEAVNRAADELYSAMVQPAAETHADYWESELGRSKFIAGDEFTAADVMMGFSAMAAAGQWGSETGRPRLKAWLDGLRARPAYLRALERDQVTPEA